MAQPIEAYFEQALREFEAHIDEQPVHLARFARGERLIGAKQFVKFLLGKPVFNPTSEPQTPAAAQ